MLKWINKIKKGNENENKIIDIQTTAYSNNLPTEVIVTFNDGRKIDMHPSEVKLIDLSNDYKLLKSSGYDNLLEAETKINDIPYWKLTSKLQ